MLLLDSAILLGSGGQILCYASRPRPGKLYGKGSLLSVFLMALMSDLERPFPLYDHT